MRGILIVTTPTEPVLSPEPKKPPDFLRSSRRSSLRRQHMRAHVAGLHVGVDVVGEVRRAVLGGHLEEKAVVLGLAPVKILGDGVGRDRVLEAAAVGVALDHDLDERLVHHVHFLLAVAVGEVHAPCRRRWRADRARSAGTVQSSVMLENGACVPQRDGVFTPKMNDWMHCLTSF